MNDSDAIRERVAQTERRLDQAESARARLWDKANAQATDLAVIRTELKGFADDIHAIRGDCQTTRTWVEAQVKQREAEEAESLRLSAGQKVAFVGAAAVVLSSIIAAIASLVSVGAL